MRSAAERSDAEHDIGESTGGVRRRDAQTPAVRRSAALISPRSMAMLQRKAGNAAVAGLVAARSNASPSAGGGAVDLARTCDEWRIGAAGAAERRGSGAECPDRRPDAVPRRGCRRRHRSGAARASARRAGRGCGGEGAEGGEVGRRTGRSGRDPAAGLGAGGDDDGVRAGQRAGQEGGAAAEEGSRGQPARPGGREEGGAGWPLDGIGPRESGLGGRIDRGREGAGAALGAAEARLQPPVPPSGVRPEADPAFTAVTGKVKATGREKRAHPPATSKAKEAQDAAVPPSGDVGSQAKAAKADSMDAQRPGSFDKKAFIAAVTAAIEAKSPKTLKEADNYKSSGKAGEVKGEVKGLVTQGKEGQAADIKAATDAPPDQSKAVPKPVTPMGPEPPGQAVPIPATGAVPKPAPAEQLNLAAGKHEVNAEMADAEVTETQLAESNEPEFEQGAGRQEGRRRTCRHRARGVPPAGGAGHRPGQGRRDGGDRAPE